MCPQDTCHQSISQWEAEGEGLIMKDISDGI
jgi:hypothetical protein